MTAAALADGLSMRDIVVKPSLNVVLLPLVRRCPVIYQSSTCGTPAPGFLSLHEMIYEKEKREFFLSQITLALYVWPKGAHCIGARAPKPWHQVPRHGPEQTGGATP